MDLKMVVRMDLRMVVRMIVLRILSWEPKNPFYISYFLKDRGIENAYRKGRASEKTQAILYGVWKRANVFAAVLDSIATGSEIVDPVAYGLTILEAELENLK